jgi:hypothetical protein
MRSLFIGFLFVSSAIPAFGGPMPPCVTATLSAKGTALVVNQRELEPGGETEPRKVLRSTFEVLLLHPERHYGGLRPVTPEHYWSGAEWSVVFEYPRIQACEHVLVTDDGEFLVLVGNTPDRAAMRIYRRREHPGGRGIDPGPDHGVLVKEIPLTMVWPDLPDGWTDHSPQWYAGGSLAFTGDDRGLVVKTRFGKTLTIDLASGAVVVQ